MKCNTDTDSDNNFLMSLDNIKAHQIGSFGLIIDILSLTNDYYIFSHYLKNTTNNIHTIKNKWLVYVREIFNIFGEGFEVKYTQPYKSKKLKGVTEYEIFINNKFSDSGVTWGRVQAEVQAYIKYTNFIINREEGAKFANDKLHLFIEKYNELYDDDVKFLSIGNTISVKCENAPHGIASFFMDRIIKPEILREIKIN